MNKYCATFLIPGSTSEGWDMPVEKISELLKFCLYLAKKYNNFFLSKLVKAIFELVSKVQYRNPFTNTNKAIDYFRAYGPVIRAWNLPCLYSGDVLLEDLLEKVGDILRQNVLRLTRDYFE